MKSLYYELDSIVDVRMCLIKWTNQLGKIVKQNSPVDRVDEGDMDRVPYRVVS